METALPLCHFLQVAHFLVEPFARMGARTGSARPMPQPTASQSAQEVLGQAQGLAAAKVSMTKEEFEDLLTSLGLSRSVSYKLLAIAKAAPALSPFIDSLPPSYHCLYALKQVDPGVLRGWVEEGAVTPSSSVKEVSEMVSLQTAAPAVSDRIRHLNSTDELGTIRCSQSVNHRRFLSELRDLLKRHPGVEFVEVGGLGPRSLTQGELEKEMVSAKEFLAGVSQGEVSESLVPFKEMAELLVAYLECEERGKRHRTKVRLAAALADADSETREAFLSEYPTASSFLV